MKTSPENIRRDAARELPQLRKFLKGIRASQNRQLDNQIHKIHDEVFAGFDCISCAACCKSLGPRIADSDISRIAAHLKIKPSVLTEKYLKVDEDNDYVFQSMPCPFLNQENLCEIYDVRPRACREYPHTDRVNFHQIIPLSLKNMETCPAVFEILTNLKNTWNP